METQNHQHSGPPPKILHSNPANFTNSHSPTMKPMMLNAWTQTMHEDFDLLINVNQDDEMRAENQALREKVLMLESRLQQHTELLTQIHATSARVQQAVGGGGAGSGAGSVKEEESPHLLTPPNSVICAPVSSQRPEVIDYKIITASGSDNDTDAIEIRLAAESLNSLSTSADSDRLEICLNDSESYPLHVKLEENPTPPHFIKRRKIDAPMTPLQDHHSNYKTQAKNNNIEFNVDISKMQKQMQQTPKQQQLQQQQPQPQQQQDNKVMVSIGPNNTCVPASIFENINWSSSSLATRKLLIAIFDRPTLATHSMTGKPSPAFKDQKKPLKQMLDPYKIQDIIFAVTRKCGASEKEVRNAITTKCADENKMMKVQMGKRRDKENLHVNDENQKSYTP